MKYKFSILILFLFVSSYAFAQSEYMTPELLWKLNRLSPVGLSDSGNEVVYSITIPDVNENSFSTKYYTVSLTGDKINEIEDPKTLIKNTALSPDGKYEVFHQKAKVGKVLASDYYPELDKSDGHIYYDLDYRHWDHWNDGNYNHVFYRNLATGDTFDILGGEPFYSPQSPFGGKNDYTWSPDGKSIYYVCKKESGTDYVTSTDTDIFRYDIETGSTVNLTMDNNGYDTSPSFSVDGKLAYMQMKTPGYESDKNDIIVMDNGQKINLTSRWDGTVYGYKWSNDGSYIIFNAPIDGTVQLFRVSIPGNVKTFPVVEQLSMGEFDVTSIIGQRGDKLLVTRTDMNHAPDIYSFDLELREFVQLTNVNEEIYSKIKMPTVVRRYVKTTDDKDMLVWVILPPDFDSNKKYPTLLYAQGGPQSALSQFYSYRWNFQLMASQGYIIVAPNRRGMPGHGVKWNEDISKDWGGQAMRDYYSAIDALAEERYVDNDRLGAIGASFGGYSVFYMAGTHEGRFKSFIAHDGVFNVKSMYGTTEEIFFINYDAGGPYWEKENEIAQKAYNEFNPINYVQNWDTPIMIIQGGKDFRVPLGQSLEAFTAAKLRGLKSKFLYFPSENHWVLQPQNGLLWQREFYKWLKETL